MLLAWILLFVIVVLAVHQLWWRRRGLPPGPFPLPLLGNALQIMPSDSESIREKFHKLFLQYPRIYTLWLGPIPMVMLNDYELIKEHMIKQGDLYAGRPVNKLLEIFRNGRFGIIITDGEQWKEQRRFSLHVLRDFGFGRNLMEERILMEVRHIIENFQQAISDRDGVVNVYQPIQTCVGNIINAVLFGRRFPTGEEVHYIKTKLDAANDVSDSPFFFLLFGADWTRKLPFVSGVWRKFDDLRITITEFFEDQFRELKETYDPEAEPDSFVGAYFKEMHDRKKKGDSLGHFSDVQLRATILDIWLAGLQTTVDTIQWAFLYMIHYPEIQTKVQEEIDSVMGMDSEIGYGDRTKLPYTTATIYELQRHINLVPMNIFRCAHETVVIDGYTIPPGTYMAPQISAVMADERYFPEPRKFKPERFLQDDGKTAVKPEQLLPFSLGKRQCLGESLARMELFMIFANTLKRFNFGKVYGEPFPSMIPRKQFNIQARDYQCTMTERK